MLNGKGIDRRLLRRFLASFLWRCSVSQVQEMTEVDIGNHYEELIGHDLLDEKPCDYIDALIMFGHDDIAKTTIFMPVGTRFRKDGNVAAGRRWFLDLIPQYRLAAEENYLKTQIEPRQRFCVAITVRDTQRKSPVNDEMSKLMQRSHLNNAPIKIASESKIHVRPGMQ